MKLIAIGEPIKGQTLELSDLATMLTVSTEVYNVTSDPSGKFLQLEGAA